MIVRVARAICCPVGVCQATEARNHIRGRVGICQAHSFRTDAVAAVFAMREPTEAMVMALLTEKCLADTQHNRDIATLDWQEMIDAALK